MPICQHCSFDHPTDECLSYKYLEERVKGLEEQKEKLIKDLALACNIREGYEENLKRKCQTELKHLKLDLEETNQKIKSKKEKITKLKQENTQYLAQIQDLETRLDTKTTELTQELEKSKQLSQDLTELSQTKETKEKSLKEKQTQLEKELQESKTSTADLRKEIAALRESQETSQKELATEQKRLQISQEDLQKQIAENREQGQTIEQLQANLAESERILKETREQLSPSKVAELETQLLNYERLKVKREEKVKELTQELGEVREQLTQAHEKEQDLISQQEQNQKDLSQLLSQLAQSQGMQTQLEQKVTDLEQALFSLAKQKLKGKKEAQRVLTELETNCQNHQETLTRKSKELSKLRIEVVELQGKLKKMPKLELDKPSLSKSEPINPWLLATLAVVVIGGLWLLNQKGGKT